MHFCSSQWTTVLWLFPRNSSQMLAPDATVVTVGEEEFPFFPGIMDFLSQSSSLLSTQMLNLPLQRDVKESGFPRLKDKQQTHFQGSKYTLHTMQGGSSSCPTPPVCAPLKPACSEPQNRFPKPSQGQTRCWAPHGDALLVCKPSPDNQGTDSLLQTGWFFCQTGISKMV